MAILEDIFNAGINLIRGSLGSYGDLIFEVYSGSYPRVGFEDAEIKVKPSTRVLTFSDFQRRTRARYSRHELINKKSVLEKVGDEPDTISLDIKLLRDLGVNVEEQIELLRRYVRDGTEESLIIGSEVLGIFVISEMTESRAYVDCFGRTLVAELNLTFEESAGDESQIETATSSDLPLIWL
ncbi:MAG: phage tail protein [Quinella sp. 1Q5]|nr:phage tail protein [Quinella sp. 1Q5]